MFLKSVAVLGGVIVLAACAAAPSSERTIGESESASDPNSSQRAARAADDETLDTSDPATMIKLQADALAKALAETNSAAPVQPPTQATAQPSTRRPTVLEPSEAPPAPTPEPVPAEVVSDTSVSPPMSLVTGTVDHGTNRRAALAAELAELLRDQWRAGDPLRDAAPLLALDVIQPGLIETDAREIRSELSPPEQRVFESMREVLREFQLGDSLCDQARFASMLERKAEPLRSRLNLSIGAPVLCSRVERFGCFTPLASSRFVAGRVHPAIVYAEISNFAERTPDAGETDGGQHIVELSQKMTLATDSDDTIVTTWAEQTVKDVSRSARRDFYLARRVDLPANLSVGRYHLKMTVRDQTTGAEAESIVTIEVVARAQP